MAPSHRGEDYNGFTRAEVASLIIDYLRRGHRVSEVRDLLLNDYGIEIGRQQAWRIIEQEAVAGRLRYYPDFDHALRDRIHERFPANGLNDLQIVPSTVPDDLALRGAETLVRLIREQHGGGDSCHIGVAGGGTLRRLARHLAGMLHEQAGNLPDELVFHAMVAGWNVEYPLRDPNAFFLYLATIEDLPVKQRFVGLHAPGVVETGSYDFVRSLQGVDEAYREIENLDIIVTSSGRWECRHSALYNLYRRYADETVKKLDDLGCIGDMMWCPLSPDGPIDLSAVGAPVRAVTLMELHDLADFVRQQGKHVLLVLAPCSGCQEPKTEILSSVLGASEGQQMVSHLVCDTRSAGGLFS